MIGFCAISARYPESQDLRSEQMHLLCKDVEGGAPDVDWADFACLLANSVDGNLVQEPRLLADVYVIEPWMEKDVREALAVESTVPPAVPHPFLQESAKFLQSQVEVVPEVRFSGKGEALRVQMEEVEMIFDRVVTRLGIQRMDAQFSAYIKASDARYAADEAVCKAREQADEARMKRAMRLIRMVNRVEEMRVEAEEEGLQTQVEDLGGEVTELQKGMQSLEDEEQRLGIEASNRAHEARRARENRHTHKNNRGWF